MASTKNDLLTLLETVERSPEYTSWRKTEPDSFLAHIFMMEDRPGKGSFQVGYYNETKERMTTFELTGDTLTMMPELEVFKRPDTPLLAFDRTKMAFDSDTIMNKADEAQAEHYPGNPIIKRFFVLQNLDIGQVYNVTLITRAFKTINLKFDAVSGELKKHHMDSLLSVE